MMANLKKCFLNSPPPPPPRIKASIALDHFVLLILHHFLVTGSAVVGCQVDFCGQWMS